MEQRPPSFRALASYPFRNTLHSPQTPWNVPNESLPSFDHLRLQDPRRPQGEEMDRYDDEEEAQAGERDKQGMFRNHPAGAEFSLLDSPRRMGCHRNGSSLFNILLLITFITCIILFTVTLIKYSELSEELKRGRPSALNNSELLEELRRWHPSAPNYSELLEELKIWRPSSLNYSQLLEELKTLRPSQLNFSEDLVAALVKGTKDLTKLLDAMCEQCPIGWVKFNNTCYLFSSLSLLQHPAKQACQAEGSNLVIIKSREEQTFLAMNTNSKGYWIDLSDVASEGKWHWGDGNPLTLTNWNAGEPNNAADREDCAEMRSDGFWNDVPCTDNFYFVCKKIASC